MPDGYILTERAIGALRRDHQQLKNEVRHLRSLASEADIPSDWGRVIRTGITTVGPDNATYPGSGNTFWIAIEAWTFKEEVGTQAVTYDKFKEYVVARTEDGSYLAEGTHVVIYKHQSRTGRRWWIRPVTTPSSSSSSTSSTSSATSSSSSVSLSSSSSSSLSSISLSSSSSSAISSSSSSLSSLSSSSSSSSCPATCHEVEVVTNVECVNGNIVVTKKKLRICGDNLCVDLV